VQRRWLARARRVKLGGKKTCLEEAGVAEDREQAAGNERLPVAALYEVLDARVYVRTAKKLVALCALKSQYGKEMKLYQWEWKGDQKGWKVGLANLRVEGLNLEQIAKDTRELAEKHGISLRWS
jgi:hypothetical protein